MTVPGWTPRGRSGRTQIDSGGLRMVVADYLPGERMAPHRHPGTQVSMVLRSAVEKGVGGQVRRRGAPAHPRRLRAPHGPRATPEERKPFFVGTCENEMLGTVDVRLRDNRELWATLGNLSARLDPFHPRRRAASGVPSRQRPGGAVLLPRPATPADSANITGTVFRRRPAS